MCMSEGGLSLEDTRRIEREAIASADAGALEEAAAALTSIIDRRPSYASALNNRAQVYRLLGRVDAALSDVNAAIELASAGTRTWRQMLVSEWRVRVE